MAKKLRDKNPDDLKKVKDQKIKGSRFNINEDEINSGFFGNEFSSTIESLKSNTKSDKSPDLEKKKTNSIEQTKSIKPAIKKQEHDPIDYNSEVIKQNKPSSKIADSTKNKDSLKKGNITQIAETVENKPSIINLETTKTINTKHQIETPDNANYTILRESNKNKETSLSENSSNKKDSIKIKPSSILIDTSKNKASLSFSDSNVSVDIIIIDKIINSKKLSYSSKVFGIIFFRELKGEIRGIVSVKKICTRFNKRASSVYTSISELKKLISIKSKGIQGTFFDFSKLLK